MRSGLRFVAMIQSHAPPKWPGCGLVPWAPCDAVPDLMNAVAGLGLGGGGGSVMVAVLLVSYLADTSGASCATRCNGLVPDLSCNQPVYASGWLVMDGVGMWDLLRTTS